MASYTYILLLCAFVLYQNNAICCHGATLPTRDVSASLGPLSFPCYGCSHRWPRIDREMFGEANFDWSKPVAFSVGSFVDSNSGVSDSVVTAGNSDYVVTAGNSDSVVTAGNSDYVGAAGNSDYVGAAGNSDYVGAAGNSDYVGAAGNGDYVGAAGNSDYVVTASNSDYVGAAGNGDYVGAAGNSDYVVTASNSDYVGAAGNSDYVVTASNSDYVEAAGNGDYVVTASNSDYVGAAGNSDYVGAAGNGDPVGAAVKGDYVGAASNGDSEVTAGNGDNEVAAGNGDYEGAAGNGDYMVAAGNGDNELTAGNGDYMVATGNGDHVVATGNSDYVVATDNGDYVVAAGNESFVGVGNEFIYENLLSLKRVKRSDDSDITKQAFNEVSLSVNSLDTADASPELIVTEKYNSTNISNVTSVEGTSPSLPVEADEGSSVVQAQVVPGPARDSVVESRNLSQYERLPLTAAPEGTVSADDVRGSGDTSATNQTARRLGNGVSPLQETGGSETVAVTNNVSESSYDALHKRRLLGMNRSWLGEFLVNGRGPVWLALNIVLLVLVICVGVLCLFRLLALRSCTPLLSRTCYLMVLLFCFTAAAFTSVHLIHLSFGGTEGLPILLTLLLTHTPALCLTASLSMVQHSAMEASRLPWPVSWTVVLRVSIVLIVLSVVGDVTVALAHSAPFLLTSRVTMTAIAMLPVLAFSFRYCRLIQVSMMLRREMNGELKLMVQPPKDSLAYEQNAARTLLKDVLPTWATFLLMCSVFTALLWTYNLGISVFLCVSRVPIWLWWFFHTGNCICQILIILLLILSCVITQSGKQDSFWHKVFTIPKDILNTPSTGNVNEHQNFVYERVSYSSGPESSQRTSSSQNETDEHDLRSPAPLSVPAAHHVRPRVSLQRSATFNCAPRLPMMYGYYPNYQHILTPGYPTTGAYCHIHPNFVEARAMPPSMLLHEGGFVRFNMPIQNMPYPAPPQQPGVSTQPNTFQPEVDIEYNSLRRFPRRFNTRHGAMDGNKLQNKFNPHEIRVPMTSSYPHSFMNQVPASPTSVPVSPYHAIPFLPASSLGLPGRSTSSFARGSSPVSQPDVKILPSPPALPSRAGSFRNHYAPSSSPLASPQSSAYSALQMTAATPIPSPHPIQVISGAPRSTSSRPTSPAIDSLAFPPPPSVPHPSTLVSSNIDLSNSLCLHPVSEPPQTHNRYLQKFCVTDVGKLPDASYENTSFMGNSSVPVKYSSASSNFSPGNSHLSSRSGSVVSIPHTKADMQLHQEKSIESTVREILSSGDRPLIRPRRHPLHSSARYSKRSQAFKEDSPHSLYANTDDGSDAGSPFGEAAPNVASSSSCIPMDAISIETGSGNPDADLLENDVKNAASCLKRNHSTAGCYFPNDRKDSFCQTDDEGNKYSSFRLSQLRQKPADWYGTWAGRRKSKNGAYSIDPNKESSALKPRDKDGDKRLSASRGSLLSIYSKFKSRKEKTQKDDSGEETERDDTEVSQTSTSDETPTPSVGPQSSVTTEEEKDENPLAEVLDDIRESKEDADWTMDILSSSSVLSDFYKLRTERPAPPALPEVSEIDV